MASKRQIVRRAYLNTLKREPDESGMANYMKHATSVERIESLLKQSAEYANMNYFHDRYKNTNLNWPLSQLFILTNHKLIYCPIGKNGNTTIKRLMTKISDIENKDIILGGNIHGITDNANTGLQLSDYNDNEIASIFSDGGYFKFSVFRNPTDRLISAYWEKFVANRTLEGSLWHIAPVLSVIQNIDSRRVDAERGITFREFTNFVISTPPRQLDAHWRPQYLYLEGMKYDKIFDLDDLSDFYHYISQRTGQDITVKSENVIQSSSGVFVSGAYNLLPEELQNCGKIDRKCFLNEELERRIASYYSVDWAIYSAVSRSKNRT